jgi:hypothetical protein
MRLVRLLLLLACGTVAFLLAERGSGNERPLAHPVAQVGGAWEPSHVAPATVQTPHHGPAEGVRHNGTEGRAILHQTWKTSQTPPELQPYIDSWQLHNPSWSLMMWNDSAMSAFIDREYAWFAPTYYRYRTGVERSDIFRYVVLHFYGGV